MLIQNRSKLSSKTARLNQEYLYFDYAGERAGPSDTGETIKYQQKGD